MRRKKMLVALVSVCTILGAIALWNYDSTVKEEARAAVSTQRDTANKAAYRGYCLLAPHITQVERNQYWSYFEKAWELPSADQIKVFRIALRGMTSQAQQQRLPCENELTQILQTVQ